MWLGWVLAVGGFVFKRIGVRVENALAILDEMHVLRPYGSVGVADGIGAVLAKIDSAHFVGVVGTGTVEGVAGKRDDAARGSDDGNARVVAGVADQIVGGIFLGVIENFIFGARA